MAAGKTLERKSDSKNGVKRLIIVGLSIILELALLVSVFFRVNEALTWVSYLTRSIGILVVLVIYGQHKTSAMKMPWIMLILAFPIVGLATYFLLGLNGATRKMRKRYEEIDRDLLPNLASGQRELDALKKENPAAGNIATYIRDYAKYPVYRNTRVEYYSQAKDGLKAQLRDLANAKKFIFMEYHAIEDNRAWHMIEKVLTERAAAGVEVRVFYDDVGSIGFVNMDFVKKLKGLGINARVFNPVAPGLNMFLNNRDHRKITVIDGAVGFTGGYNLANEYFGMTHPYGQWKDTGLRLEGEAVRSLTITFLEMWNAVKNGHKEDYSHYIDSGLSLLKPDENASLRTNSYVQPYADSPLDGEHVGEEVYISIVNKANRYCYFMTPYLVITDEMAHALSLAAKRGVDVRIITPGIPDKKMIYSVTRSFYNCLVRNGVRIFEWTPGFTHGKMCVSDDYVATVGTINLDYRSLYHHFENGCVLYEGPVVREIKADFMETFPQCREVTEEYKNGKRSHGLRLGQMLLRLFAELL